MSCSSYKRYRESILSSLSSTLTVRCVSDSGQKPLVAPAKVPKTDSPGALVSRSLNGYPRCNPHCSCCLVRRRKGYENRVRRCTPRHRMLLTATARGSSRCRNRDRCPWHPSSSITDLPRTLGYSGKRIPLLRDRPVYTRRACTAVHLRQHKPEISQCTVRLRAIRLLITALFIRHAVPFLLPPHPRSSRDTSPSTTLRRTPSNRLDSQDSPLRDRSRHMCGSHSRGRRFRGSTSPGRCSNRKQRRSDAFIVRMKGARRRA